VNDRGVAVTLNQKGADRGSKMILEGHSEMELTANIHREDGSDWADVPKLPGCFASDETLDELFDSLQEGIRLYLAEGDSSDGGASSQPLRLAAAVLSDAPSV
jgi:predicted RNase H-like HicB family nuclease